MKFKIILILIFANNFSFSQSTEFSANDLKKVINTTKFKGVKTLKDIDTPQEVNNLIDLIYSDSGMLKQLNISGWAICEYKPIDNFDTYNYYYSDISRYTFDTYCKELNALMILDGVIKQPK
jgi:hypothetical protein